jgi:hypothetical protein
MAAIMLLVTIAGRNPFLPGPSPAASIAAHSVYGLCSGRLRQRRCQRLTESSQIQG